jgi:hypothetical protein
MVRVGPRSPARFLARKRKVPKRVPKRLPLQMGAFHEMKGDAVTKNASA